MIYYHVFGTAREKSLDRIQDIPIFWRTGIQNLFSIITGGYKRQVLCCLRLFVIAFLLFTLKLIF